MKIFENNVYIHVFRTGVGADNSPGSKFLFNVNPQSPYSFSVSFAH